ncbi:phosphatase PAP2 family protein [Cohnella terricola]|uniref:Phosphatase PAP2 family protein n=1 Tax=Cohnella terricola TaxID=1289167 RepID=A0A559JFX5_9BACL|nr:phosphatase PAP2 family protein [Cohnella terricola]TVX98767.1 phosphatase PAP2 family protein [Cohnella terricola]
MMNIDEMAATETSKSSRYEVYKPLLGLLAVPVINLIYVLQNRPWGNVYSLVTEVDRNLPFLPEFAVPYMLWYPFLFLVFFLILRKDKREYYQTLIAMCCGILLSNLVYLVFQTMVPRPEVPSTGFFNGLVNYLYSHDEPYNCFPSVHVLTSTLMVLGSRSLGWKLRIPIVLFASSIIASTLFIKQHVIADLLAAMLLAKFVFWAADKLIAANDARLAGKAMEARYANHER